MTSTNKVITKVVDYFYVPEDAPYKLPPLSPPEEWLFDYLNNKGPTSLRLLYHAKPEDYSQKQIAWALATLQNAHLIKRDKITADMGD